MGVSRTFLAPCRKTMYYNHHLFCGARKWCTIRHELAYKRQKKNKCRERVGQTFLAPWRKTVIYFKRHLFCWSKKVVHKKTWTHATDKRKRRWSMCVGQYLSSLMWKDSMFLAPFILWAKHYVRTQGGHTDARNLQQSSFLIQEEMCGSNSFLWHSKKKARFQHHLVSRSNKHYTKR